MDKDMLLNELRESRQEILPNGSKGGLSIDDVRELNELYARIKAIDLDKVVEERIASRTPVEQLVEDLKANVPTKRALSKPKVHYHTKRAAKRKRIRVYQKEVYRPHRKAKLAETLTTAQGWWDYINISWKKRGTKVDLTFEEFEEHIYPVTAGVGLVFVVLRYDIKKPIELTNLIVKDTKSRAVLFDGMEHKLRSLGMIL